MNRRQRRCRAKCRRAPRAKAAAGKGKAEASCWSPIRLAAEVFSEGRDRLSFALLWAVDWWHRHQRPNEWWGSSLMLLVTVVSAAFTIYAALRPAPSAAGISFKTGVDEGSGALRSFAVPEPGDRIPIVLQLTPHHQDLRGVAVVIAPPLRAEMTDRCYYAVGDSPRRECAIAGGEVRIDVACLKSGETLRISAEARVVARIETRETIAIEMGAAEVEASRRGIDLLTPGQDEEGDGAALVSRPLPPARR
jgi:hypothetical protein